MRRFFSNVAAMVVGLTSVVASNSANAAVIATFPAESIPISSQLFAAHTDFDINNDGIRDAVFLHNFQFGGIRALNGNGVIARTIRPDLIERGIEPLPEGALIRAEILGANLHWFRDNRLYVEGGFSTADIGICVNTGCDGYFFGQTAYMGFELQMPDGPHYGWAKLWVSDRPNFAAGLIGWAWETEPNTPIIAGAVPEPAAASLAVLGLLCCSGRRRHSPCCRRLKRGQP